MFRNPVSLLILLVLVMALAGVVAIGAFPPGAVTSQVERTLPNDRFQPR